MEYKVDKNEINIYILNVFRVNALGKLLNQSSSEKTKQVNNFRMQGIFNMESEMEGILGYYKSMKHHANQNQTIADLNYRIKQIEQIQDYNLIDDLRRDLMSLKVVAQGRQVVQKQQIYALMRGIQVIQRQIAQPSIQHRHQNLEIKP
eukprot:403338804